MIIQMLIVALLSFPIGGMGRVAGFPLEPESRRVVKLPKPRYDGEVSLERCLRTRRSIRSYQNQPLSISEISQLLWAAQGITSRQGKRTTPSAGALYPLETYLVVGNVTGLHSGVYKYRPSGHALAQVLSGDRRGELSKAALRQKCVSESAVVVVIAAVYERTQKKYGKRAVRYVHMEAGHAAQNVWLQANSLKLGTVTVGAFADSHVQSLLGMAPEEMPLYLLPVGRVK